MKGSSSAGLKTVEAAIEQMLGGASPITESESIFLERALGRVLAQDQQALVDVPPADNSAMDGFALNSADCRGGAETTLTISQRLPAGTAPAPLQPGTAARIFTGAAIPAGADAVVIQENCRWQQGRVAITGAVEPGANIRPRGQDILRGATLLRRGHRLRPQDMGLLASAGMGRIAVYRPIRVAFFSTGDELVEPGQPLAPGQIYNSNRFTLAGMLDALGMEKLDLGIVPDSPAATEKILRQGAAEADCILSSGGVSVGEEDHVKSSVEKLGSLTLWKLAIKPGKPLAFGQVLGVPFIGLPGNPASVFVTFAIVARPFLLKLQGQGEVLPNSLVVRARFSRPGPAKRQEYLRARLVVNADGGLWAELSGNQSSGILSTASVGNGFAVHRLGQSVAEGDNIPFLPYSALWS